MNSTQSKALQISTPTEQTYAWKEARDGAIESGMNEGMEACYKQLDTLFA